MLQWERKLIKSISIYQQNFRIFKKTGLCEFNLRMYDDVLNENEKIIFIDNCVYFIVVMG